MITIFLTVLKVDKQIEFDGGILTSLIEVDPKLTIKKLSRNLASPLRIFIEEIWVPHQLFETNKKNWSVKINRD